LASKLTIAKVLDFGKGISCNAPKLLDRSGRGVGSRLGSGLSLFLF